MSKTEGASAHNFDPNIETHYLVYSRFEPITGISYTQIDEYGFDSELEITPDEMSGITITLPYRGRTGRAETLTVRASLKYTVALKVKLKLESASSL